MHGWIMTHSALTPAAHSSAFADQLAVTTDFARDPKETKHKAGRLTPATLSSRNIGGALYHCTYPDAHSVVCMARSRHNFLCCRRIKTTGMGSVWIHGTPSLPRSCVQDTAQIRATAAAASSIS
jgi:hypothetical protein